MTSDILLFKDGSLKVFWRMLEKTYSRLCLNLQKINLMKKLLLISLVILLSACAKGQYDMRNTLYTNWTQYNTYYTQGDYRDAERSLAKLARGAALANMYQWGYATDRTSLSDSCLVEFDLLYGKSHDETTFVYSGATGSTDSSWVQAGMDSLVIQGTGSDGDIKIYNDSEIIFFKFDGVASNIVISKDDIYSQLSGGFGINDGVSSSSVIPFVPKQSDSNSGFTSLGADKPAIVSGGDTILVASDNNGSPLVDIKGDLGVSGDIDGTGNFAIDGAQDMSFNSSTGLLISLKARLGSSGMGGNVLTFGTTATAGISGAIDTLYHNGHTEFGDSTKFNYTERQGYESWLGASINGYVFYDSISDAGEALRIKILGPIQRLFDRKDGEIAWLSPSGEWEYTIKGRPSETIYKLQAGIEITARHVAWNRGFIYLLILMNLFLLIKVFRK